MKTVSYWYNLCFRAIGCSASYHRHHTKHWWSGKDKRKERKEAKKCSMNQRGLKIMIVSAVTVSFRQKPSWHSTRHSTRPIYDFLDLTTDTIHRYIHSNHSMITEHPVVQHLVQLPCVGFFFKPYSSLPFTPFLCASLHLSTCYWIISLSVKHFLHPMYFIILSITCFHYPLLFCAHTCFPPSMHICASHLLPASWGLIKRSVPQGQEGWRL